MAILSKIRSLFTHDALAIHPLEREGLEALDTYGSAEEGDRKVLAQLLEHGADLSRPRHVVHYLHFAQTDDRERAYVELEAKGYEVHPGGLIRNGERPYSLIAERTGQVNDQKIAEERVVLSEIASRFDGEYDGWEAALD